MRDGTELPVVELFGAPRAPGTPDAPLRGMRDYPVSVEVVSPPRFDRIQLLVRLGVSIVLGAVGITAGWLTWFLYGALPLIAAIAISSIGAAVYMTDVGPRLWRALTWLQRLSAYMGLLVDRFPAAEDQAVRIELRPTGHPTVGSALLRLLTSIPSGLVLSVLWFVSGILCFVSVFFVLFGAAIPGSILGYQRGILRWQTRLLAYHASLVEEYPPFSLDTGMIDTGATAAPSFTPSAAH